MRAIDVFRQNNGEVTKAYYARLGALGPHGQLAVALFRAQKRSTAAKGYRGGRFRRAAYDVKNWSLGQICACLRSNGLGYGWGWGRDDSTPGFPWVLYVELPSGQVSFHSAERLDGPDYAGQWDGLKGMSELRIVQFCDAVTAGVFFRERAQGSGQ